MNKKLEYLLSPSETDGEDAEKIQGLLKYAQEQGISFEKLFSNLEKSGTFYPSKVEEQNSAPPERL